MVVALLSLANLPSANVHQEAIKNTIAYLDWIKSNTACDARMLSNHRTPGTYQVLTGRASVDEGMGPYLRPPMLDRILHLIKTRMFYQHPEQGRSFLRQRGVDYVIAYRREPANPNLRAFGANLQDLSRQPFLRPVFQNQQVSIFQVVGLPGSRSLPLATDRPGYDCNRDPIQL